ncbi:phage tail domain-containing protein [Arthrobacter russicus]|uniref:Minor tail protein n=2 Tax=Bacillati TaxID=1783272 RepID=A0ABU1JDV1_9MICC|nr:phage tail domain-containing protein [Arthrobacter russicus]MDR6270590.1 hypothetical protein [Arthrobacter russicus]
MIPSHVLLAPEKVHFSLLDRIYNRPNTNVEIVLDKDGLLGWKGSPSMRRETIPRLGFPGSFSVNGVKDERLISVAATAYCDNELTADDLEDELAAILADGTEGVLTVTEGRKAPRWVSAWLATEIRVSRPSLTMVRFSYQVVAPNPRKFGATLAGATEPFSSGGGLYTMPLFGSPAAPGILDFGNVGSVGTVSIKNLGTADTAPKFTITGSIPEGLQIIRQDTGDVLQYVGVVLPGQTLLMDSDSGSVTLDGEDRGAQLIGRGWSRVFGGSTATWLFLAPNASGANLTVEVPPAWW